MASRIVTVLRCVAAAVFIGMAAYIGHREGQDAVNRLSYGLAEPPDSVKIMASWGYVTGALLVASLAASKWVIRYHNRPSGKIYTWKQPRPYTPHLAILCLAGGWLIAPYRPLLFIYGGALTLYILITLTKNAILYALFMSQCNAHSIERRRTQFEEAVQSDGSWAAYRRNVPSHCITLAYWIEVLDSGVMTLPASVSAVEVLPDLCRNYERELIRTLSPHMAMLGVNRCVHWDAGLSRYWIPLCPAPGETAHKATRYDSLVAITTVSPIPRFLAGTISLPRVVDSHMIAWLSLYPDGQLVRWALDYVIVDRWWGWGYGEKDTSRPLEDCSADNASSTIIKEAWQRARLPYLTHAMTVWQEAEHNQSLGQEPTTGSHAQLSVPPAQPASPDEWDGSRSLIE